MGRRVCQQGHPLKIMGSSGVIKQCEVCEGDIRGVNYLVCEECSYTVCSKCSTVRN